MANLRQQLLTIVCDRELSGDSQGASSRRKVWLFARSLVVFVLYCWCVAVGVVEMVAATAAMAERDRH